MTNIIIGWSPFSDDEALLTTYADAAGAAAENDYAAMEWRRIQDMPGWTTFLAAYQAANFPNVPDDPGMYGILPTTPLASSSLPLTEPIASILRLFAMRLLPREISGSGRHLPGL